jgi:DNA-binding NarL/FixJ family response regulator
MRRPDVVIVVGGRADGSTRAAIEMAKRRWRQSIVIALADTDRVEDGIALVRRGADTWLPRKDGLSDLRSMLARIGAGERLLVPSDALSQIATSLRETQAGSQSRLTIRERQVLACFAQGLSRPEIAATLGISSATLRTHVQNILRKLDLHSIRQAAALTLQEAEAPSGHEA